MATRGEIRDAFTSELEAVSGDYDVVDAGGAVVDTVTLSAEHIGLRDPEYTEPLPAIVYHENYRRVQYNGVGAAPDMRTYNADGSVDQVFWREYIEAQFIIDVRASDEPTKEPIYEALRSRFAQYQFSQWDESSVHADIIDIDVIDSTSVDTGDTEDVIRGDQLEVRITFFRDYSLDTANITSVESAVDADGDGTVEYTYSTS